LAATPLIGRLDLSNMVMPSLLTVPIAGTFRP
jgi:hypothetical protein